MIEDVEWSLVYIAFLVYTFVAITQQLNIGDVAIASALLGLFLGRAEIRAPQLLLWLGIFLAWTAVGYFETTHRAMVYQEVVTLGKIWLICLVAVNALDGWPRVRLFMIAYLLFYALYPVRGALFNYFLAEYSVVGRAIWNFQYENPNDLAALTLLPLAFACSLLVGERKGIVKLGAFASVLLLPGLIMLTQSRGGIIAVAAFGAAIVFHMRKSARNMSFVGLVLLLAITMAPSGVWQRMEDISFSRPTWGEKRVTSVERKMSLGSSRYRWEILKTGVRIANDHPVFGVGYGAFPPVFSEYSGGYRKSAHNMYVAVAAETGYVGLTIFLGLLVATFYRAERFRRRHKRHFPKTANQAWFLELGLFSFLVAGMFGQLEKLAALYVYIAFIWIFTESQLAPRVSRAGGGRRLQPSMSSDSIAPAHRVIDRLRQWAPRP